MAPWPRIFLLARRLASWRRAHVLPGERDDVVDDGARPHGQSFRIGEIERDKPESARPGSAQELFDDRDGEKLAGAAAIPEAEGRVAGGVADRVCRAINDAIDGAKHAVGQFRLAAIGDGQRCDWEGATGEPHLLAPRLVIVDGR